VFQDFTAIMPKSNQTHCVTSSLLQEKLPQSEEAHCHDTMNPMHFAQQTPSETGHNK